MENSLGFVDKRRGRGLTDDGVAAANLTDVAALRSRLTAISSSTYTSARLDKMTKNDMIYAVRKNDEAAGVK